MGRIRRIGGKVKKKEEKEGCEAKLPQRPEKKGAGVIT